MLPYPREALYFQEITLYCAFVTAVARNISISETELEADWQTRLRVYNVWVVTAKDLTSMNAEHKCKFILLQRLNRAL